MSGVFIVTLSSVNKGEIIEIVNISDSTIRAQAIRLCIYEGSKLTCSEIVPKGPIVLSNKMQEIAISRKLAEQIEVLKVS